MHTVLDRMTDSALLLEKKDPEDLQDSWRQTTACCTCQEIFKGGDGMVSQQRLKYPECSGDGADDR